jgi:enoyl-CoA hydratase/carnithine racemase
LQRLPILRHSPHFQIEVQRGVCVLRLRSDDGTQRLSQSLVTSLTRALKEMAEEPSPMVITGSVRFFSAGADLNEISHLTGPAACEFAKMGQDLMLTIERFPAPVLAAVSGYCMGGGLDLALACHARIAAPNAVFGHRGAALGLITGWGGTQRLPRLVGKGRALQMFLAAEKVDAQEALRIGLVNAASHDPVGEAIEMTRKWVRMRAKRV